MTLTETLKNDIECFLIKSGMSKTMLGLKALSHPHFIFRFLSGKLDPKLSTVDKLYDFMNYKLGKKK